MLGSMPALHFCPTALNWIAALYMPYCNDTVLCSLSAQHVCSYRGRQRRRPESSKTLCLWGVCMPAHVLAVITDSHTGLHHCMPCDDVCCKCHFPHTFFIRYQMKYPERPPLKPDSEDMMKRQETVPCGHDTLLHMMTSTPARALSTLPHICDTNISTNKYED